MPLAKWGCPDLAQQVVTDGICTSVTATMARCWLAEDAIKPWQHQSWIFITDPNLASRVARVLTCITGAETGNHGQRTTINAAVHWPPWPPATSTKPESSTGSNSPTESNRLPG